MTLVWEESVSGPTLIFSLMTLSYSNLYLPKPRLGSSRQQHSRPSPYTHEVLPERTFPIHLSTFFLFTKMSLHGARFITQLKLLDIVLSLRKFLFPKPFRVTCPVCLSLCPSPTEPKKKKI